MHKFARTALVGAAAVPLAILTPGLAFADEEAPAAGPLDAATGALPVDAGTVVGLVTSNLPAVPQLPVPLPVDPNAVAGTVLGALPLPAAPAADDASAEAPADEAPADDAAADVL
ncbi:MAG: hypothetical protein J0I34_29950 [Pseudonocardia sp.]|uniref:hypothetical protein n=1 Tax=unclassified Pseudonocardia TaxID=2619320 RepID=UPI00086EC2E2|nr:MULTISPECIES: hypothetical protein [unclassified Pseudonocardia]MBN9112996.1 hypothetical protein [Pseudonocardia sp.]ODU25837.1 MAG: hypothetical protein ABS80_08910 [Pseudonocardia sp. SCN 72-51]ODV05596.1 MAG: hypothetical protein ABT15_15845 [Pseudonocardia sp. SCN 73-27]